MVPSLLEAIVLGACLVLSAFFSASETSLTALSESKARSLTEAGRFPASTLKLWLDKPQGVLTAILIMSHAVNTLTAVVATVLALRTFGSIYLTVVVVLVTFTLLLFGEITPKTFAKIHAEKIAPLVMPVITLVYFVTLPAVLAFTSFSRGLGKLGGGNLTRTGHFVTEEDIAYMIRLGHKEGVIEQQEGRMLASIFELGDTLVKEVMVPRTEISALPLDATLDQVVLESRAEGHSRLPVYGEGLDDVRGFFHTKDLLAVLPDRAKGFHLRNHLRPVLFVPELMKVSELLKLFQKKKTHLAIVVDEYGGTSGIVALEDVLEEIVGEIQDEFDEEDAAFKKLDEHRFVADGRAGLYELGEALGVTFPQDGGYETLGGFLIHTAGKMPQRGDRVPFAGWAFVVKDADEKRVARIEIERVPTTDDEDAPKPPPADEEPKRPPPPKLVKSA
jgi:putative hemolysin